MYRLAKMLGMKKLEGQSLEAIKPRLSEGNIVPELFSRLTSSYPEVAEMEMEFLREHLTDDVTEKLTEMVRKAFTPEFSYCANVMADVVKMLASSAGMAAGKSRKRRRSADNEDSLQVESRPLREGAMRARMPTMSTPTPSDDSNV